MLASDQDSLGIYIKHMSTAGATRRRGGFQRLNGRGLGVSCDRGS